MKNNNKNIDPCFRKATCEFDAAEIAIDLVKAGREKSWSEIASQGRKLVLPWVKRMMR